MGSRPDGLRGAYFVLTLPLRVPTAADAAASAAATSTPPPALTVQVPLHLHLLIADDNATNRRIAARHAGDMGCTCTVVTDGDEVAPAVAREAFDAVLLDVHMLRMNGDAACVALRAGGFTAPVIAVTGNATAPDAEAYTRMGFTSTLGKPFGSRDLRACLERVVVKS